MLVSDGVDELGYLKVDGAPGLVSVYHFPTHHLVIRLRNNRDQEVQQHNQVEELVEQEQQPTPVKYRSLPSWSRVVLVIEPIVGWRGIDVANCISKVLDHKRRSFIQSFVVLILDVDASDLIEKTEGDEPHDEEDKERSHLAEDVSDQLDEWREVVAYSHEKHKLESDEDQKKRVERNPEMNLVLSVWCQTSSGNYWFWSPCGDSYDKVDDVEQEVSDVKEVPDIAQVFPQSACIAHLNAFNYYQNQLSHEARQVGPQNNSILNEKGLHDEGDGEENEVD